MEGFLLKKGRGDSSFGRRNWKKRWFVLEQQELAYYEDLDLETGEPIEQKGIHDVSGCEIHPITHPDKKFAFVVQHSKRAPLFLQAEDAKMMNTWVKALSEAARGEFGPRPINYEACYRNLGLEMSDNPNATEINRAFRKLALKLHPDKGGDFAKFEPIQESFNLIMAKLDEEERNQHYDLIEIEATILKGPPGVGLGMVVSEDSKTGEIRIKKILPDMAITYLSPNAGGSLRPLDTLVAVRNESVEHMPLARVVQKISDLRVPVNTTVTLTFTRHVLKSEYSNEEPEQVMADGGAIYVPPSPEAQSVQQDTDSTASPVSTGNFNFVNIPAPTLQETQQHERDTAAALKSISHLDPVAYVATMAENEELKNDLETSLQQLQQANTEKNDLKKLNKHLIGELNKYKSMWSEAVKKQHALELQLKQTLLKDTVTEEEVQQSKASVAKVTSKILRNETIQMSAETENYLKTVGLGNDEAQEDKQKAVQRQAISAVAAVDNSGLMLQKWAAGGESVVQKLSKLEEHIQQLENSRGDAEVPRFKAAAAAINTSETSPAQRSPKPGAFKNMVKKTINANAFTRRPGAGGTSTGASTLPRTHSSFQ